MNSTENNIIPGGTPEGKNPSRYGALAMGALALIALGYLAVEMSESREADALLTPNKPEIVALGMQIYTENCASCHGSGLEGQPDWRSPGANGRLPAPPHDVTGHTWHHTDDVLFGITKYGTAKFAGIDDFETDMPVYEDILTDSEIMAVLSYIKAQWPKDIQERHDQMNLQKTN